MIVYIVTIASCIILILVNEFEQRKSTLYHFGRQNSKERINVSNILFIIIVCYLILIIGLRSKSVGIDTGVYSVYYPIYSKRQFDISSLLELDEDAGYVLLCRVCGGYLGLSWTSFSLLIAAIYVVPIMILIKKYSCNAPFSILIFVLSGYFTFAMSTIRQSIAIALCIIAYIFYRDEKFKISILSLVLAATFHISALIFILYIIFLRVKITQKKFLSWIFAILIIDILGFSALRSLLSYFLSITGRNYSYLEGTSGLLTEIFFILTICLAYFIFWYNPGIVEDHQDEIKAILLSAAILPIVAFHPALFRSYYYFSIFEILFIPLIVKESKILKIDFLICTSYLLAYFYLFVTQSMTIKGIVPYYFFWQ